LFGDLLWSQGGFRVRKAPLYVAILAVLALVIAVVAAFSEGQTEAGFGTGMEALLIDMDVTGNDATTVGTIEQCARIDLNGVQDADETDVDTLTFDVVAINIPEIAPMIAVGFGIFYPEDVLTIQSADKNFLLLVNEGSQLFDASEITPDTDGNNSFRIDILDIGDGEPESGSGVLVRFTISADEGAPAGQYLLRFDPEQSFHVIPSDPVPLAGLPETLGVAAVAINQECTEIVTPSPTPSPSPVPIPKGDVDCSNSVDLVDALNILRFVAALSPIQPPNCPSIESLVGDSVFGDMDCNDVVDLVDALLILRFIAALSVNLPPGCAPIGT
jgi:hypothetical protein